MCDCWFGGGGGGVVEEAEKGEVLSTIGTGNIVKDGPWDELCRSGSLMSCLDYFGRVGGLDCLGRVGERKLLSKGEGGQGTFGSVVYM